jgi:hypothetical protein
MHGTAILVEFDPRYFPTVTMMQNHAPISFLGGQCLYGSITVQEDTRTRCSHEDKAGVMDPVAIGLSPMATVTTRIKSGRSRWSSSTLSPL